MHEIMKIVSMWLYTCEELSSSLCCVCIGVGYGRKRAYLHQSLQDEDVHCTRCDADVIWCHPQCHQLCVSWTPCVCVCVWVCVCVCVLCLWVCVLCVCMVCVCVSMYVCVCVCVFECYAFGIVTCVLWDCSFVMFITFP